ncbi:MAG: Competence protein ComM [Betaproteobacteria bacterium ADurb.Bin341]|nr:MAG: Competence protein ComM [Betaproteobacteria bacterium ADurb.Bin341]
MRTLEVMRQPLEDKVVTISRSSGSLCFPANFMLVAAMNPCPCGFHGDASGRCRCTPDQVARYRSRLSGPFIDRIDLLVEVPLVAPETLQQAADGETSEVVRQRVTAAQTKQRARQGKSNAALTAREIHQYCQPDAAGSALLNQIATRLGFSARALHRVLRVARSIADLADSAGIQSTHIAEAAQYRRLARPT